MITRFIRAAARALLVGLRAFFIQLMLVSNDAAITGSKALS